jgi:hypothetical protein
MFRGEFRHFQLADIKGVDQIMKDVQEMCSRHYGSYRAEFAGNELGKLPAPPEIKADYEAVKFPVYDETSAAGYRRITNKARLFGEISMDLPVRDELWQLLFTGQWQSGELILIPEKLSGCMHLRFPSAQLLPRWEFEPSCTGTHFITLHWQLSEDSDGKLFYTA